MKLIIDIDESLLDGIKSDDFDFARRVVKNFQGTIASAIANGTPIPDNATNGDVIKAMFPNIDFTEMAITVHATTKVTSNGVKGSISYDFWKEWWNALYQKGGKE